MKQPQFLWTNKTAIKKNNSTGLSVTLKKGYFDYDYLEKWVTSENESLWKVGHLEFDNFEFIDFDHFGKWATSEASLQKMGHFGKWPTSIGLVWQIGHFRRRVTSQMSHFDTITSKMSHLEK